MIGNNVRVLISDMKFKSVKRTHVSNLVGDEVKNMFLKYAPN